MGFRPQSYCTVWEITPKSDTLTSGRISISRKNRQTGEYEEDFSGFVSFVGTACAKKATGLKERDRIRLGDVDVTTRYNKETNTKYTNYKIFSFEIQEETDGGKSDTGSASSVDSGEVDTSDLPF